MVFVDVLGLSEIIDHLGLEAAVGQLQDYVATLTALATRHHGFVVSSDIATRGVKLIIAFGAPVAHEYAPSNAARFALELDDTLRGKGLEVAHKIGVNGGHVFAGEVGPPSRRQYTVMGDAVNLAARLMAAAEPGHAFVSRDLLDHVSDAVCARELEPITVKGKERPVAVCVLAREGAGGATSGGEQISGAVGTLLRGGLGRNSRLGRLFGRRAELERLARAWELAREGRGQTVLIEGEPGVGKTRLLDEALRGIAASGRVVRSACFEHLQAAPFAPWLGVLHGVCGTSPDDPKERRTRAVRAYLRRHLPDWLEFGSLLGPVLNVGLPQSPVVASLEARPRREKLVELAAQVALSAAESGPCAIVLEDLHWADDSSRELLAYLVGHAGEAPVLLLLTTRPSEAAAGLVGAEVARVLLAELSQSESLAMVREALDVADFPAEIGEAIYAKTKGNPLFLEEVVHSLRQPGVLERILGASSVTRAAELATLEIPDRVQGLLMSRIDRLPAEAREVLKAGAVVGPSFDRRLLGALEDTLLASVPLDRAFDELLSAALVVPADDAASVSFRHALVQDVAYDSLPFARRRDLHGRVARCLESLQGPVDHGVLVHHYSRAGDGAKTRVHAVKASEGSIAVYAHREAVDYLDIALGTVRGRSPTDTCLRSRFEELEGGCLQTFGRHDEAILRLLSSRRRWASTAVRRTAGAALRDVAPIDDADARDSLLCWKAAVSMQRGPAAYKRAIRWLDMAASALPAPRAGLAAQILISKSGSLVRLGRYHEALGLLDEALALARGEDDPGLTGYGNAIRCLALCQLGRCPEAIVAGHDAITAYERAGDLAGEALARMNLGMAYQLMDNPREGLEHMELSLAIYVRLGHKSGMEQMHHNIGAVLLQLGEMDEGIRHLQQTIAAWGTEGCPPLQVGWAFVLLAQAYLDKEEIPAAETALRRGREILEGIDAHSFLLDTDSVEAQLDLAHGDLERAESTCRRVIAAASAAGAAPAEAEALRVLGQVRVAQGRPEAAVEALEACLALADASGSHYARGLALVVLAEAKAACTEGDATCEDLLREAIRLFERMGTRGELKRALDVRERLFHNASPAVVAP
jgi:class 3 adenylate cyclase/tetratricopeptide (TPR) repeat protein